MSDLSGPFQQLPVQVKIAENIDSSLCPAPVNRRQT